jgi:hypothetical protein
MFFPFHFSAIVRDGRGKFWRVCSLLAETTIFCTHSFGALIPKNAARDFYFHRLNFLASSFDDNRA